MTDVKFAMERIKEPDKKVGFDSTVYTKEPGTALLLNAEPFLNEETRNRCVD